MDLRLAPLGSLLRLNTELFRRGLAGLSEEDALHRPGPQANHPAFLALHLLDARGFLLGLLGGDGSHPFAAELEGARGIDDIERYPALGEIVAAWDEMAERLEARLPAVSSEELEAEAGGRFPVDDGSVLGGVAFLVEHEAYHIGQLGYLRKLLGYGSLTGR